MKEDGIMIICSMAATLLSLVAMASDRNLHEVFSDLGADTSSSFVQQSHKHPQCIVASIDHPKAMQCHQCLDVEVNNHKIRPLSHCNAFFNAQILPHGLHPNRHQHPTQQHH
jgi:hypothetical protein